jgi:hypothetical protein
LIPSPIFRDFAIPAPPETIKVPDVVVFDNAEELSKRDVPVPTPLLMANPETEDLLLGSVKRVPPIPTPPATIKAPVVVEVVTADEFNIIEFPVPTALLNPNPEIEEVLLASVNNVPPIPTPPVTINAPEVVFVVTADEFNIIEFPVPTPLLNPKPDIEEVLDASVNNVPPIPTPPETINAPVVVLVVTADEFNIIDDPVPTPLLMANPETEDLLPGSVKRVPPIPTPPATTNAPVVVEVVTVVE